MDAMDYLPRGTISCHQPELNPSAPYKFSVSSRVMWMEPASGPNRRPRQGVVNRRGTYNGDGTAYIVWPDHTPEGEVLIEQKRLYAWTDEGWREWNPQEPMARLEQWAVVKMLIDLARAAWSVADNCEEDGTTHSLTVWEDDFRELERCLDALDELPEPGPNIVGTGPAKASAFLGFNEGGQQFVGSNDLKVGIWFQAAVSGLYYRNAQACGAVSGVIIDGRIFRPVEWTRELHPALQQVNPELVEPTGPARRFCRQIEKCVAVESCPMKVPCQRLAGERPDPNDLRCPIDYGRQEPGS